MRPIPLLMVCSLFCGCPRPSADARAQKASPPVNSGKPDLFKVFDSVFERYGTLGYEKLSGPEKVFVCVWELESEVNNGGFRQYYFNTSGDYALDAIRSLEAIDVRHTANLVRQMNALFGESGPSPDRATRQRQLDALGDARIEKMNEADEEFYKYKDDLDELLGAYVSRNAEAFGLK